MKRIDPTEWANKKKAQLERAKQLREERKNQIGSNDTFTPQINPPRKLPNGGVHRGDSLDNLTEEVSASRPMVDDIMEQPLPGQRNRQQQQQDTGFEGAPSPGSDTLGKELRRYGGAPSNPSTDIQPRNLNNTHFKSKFMQQYDQPEPQQSPSSNKNPPRQQQQNQPDNDELFMNQLRGGDKRSNGPGWNDDTSFGGFDSNSNNAKRAPARTKPVRPSVHRTQQNDDQDDYNSGATWDNMDQSAAPPRSRVPPNGVQTKLTPRTAGEVRSNLSLLKSKIRQSESAGKTGSFGGQGRTSLGGSGGFEPEEEFQSSMGARQRQQGGSKTSFGSDSHTNSNISFKSYASGYDDQPEEPLVPRNRATRLRPRGIASDQQGSFSQPGENEDDGYSNNYNSRNAPPVSSKSQPQNRQQGMSNDQKRTTAGYEPSVGTGRGLNGNNNARNNNFGGNDAPSGVSIDDVPAVASRSNNFNLPPDAFPPSSMQEEDAGGPQMECPTCGRHFNPNSFQKHVKICEKVFVNKRKAFDSTKMRVQDNPELLKILTKTKKEEEKAARKAAAMAEKQAVMAAGRNRPVQNEEENFMVAKPKPKMAAAAQEQPVGEAQPLWKQQSNAFREAMKAARAVKIAMETGAPLPAVVPSGPDPSLIPCPHCGRRFNAKAADRHIPQCQNIKAKPTSLKRGSGINAANGVGAPAVKAKGKGRF